MALLTPEQAADELGVRALIQAYSDAVTRRDAAALSGFFTPDGAWDLPGLEPIVGGAAIVATLEGLLATLPFLAQLVHGTVVQLGGDGSSATARSTVAEWTRDASGGGGYIVGVYRDDCVKDGDGWHFRHRRFDFLYRGRVDLPGRIYPHPAGPPGGERPA